MVECTRWASAPTVEARHRHFVYVLSFDVKPDLRDEDMGRPEGEPIGETICATADVLSSALMAPVSSRSGACQQPPLCLGHTSVQPASISLWHRFHLHRTSFVSPDGKRIITSDGYYLFHSLGHRERLCYFTYMVITPVDL